MSLAFFAGQQVWFSLIRFLAEQKLRAPLCSKDLLYPLKPPIQILARDDKRRSHSDGLDVSIFAENAFLFKLLAEVFGISRCWVDIDSDTAPQARANF